MPLFQSLDTEAVGKPFAVHIRRLRRDHKRLFIAFVDNLQQRSVLPVAHHAQKHLFFLLRPAAGGVENRDAAVEPFLDFGSDPLPGIGNDLHALGGAALAEGKHSPYDIAGRKYRDQTDQNRFDAIGKKTEKVSRFFIS